jgi:hypothetical protein
MNVSLQENVVTPNYERKPCAGYMGYPLANSVVEKSSRGILPFYGEGYILLMSATLRKNLPPWQSNNFCQNVQKKQVKTFVICA